MICVQEPENRSWEGVDHAHESATLDDSVFVTDTPSVFPLDT